MADLTRRCWLSGLLAMLGLWWFRASVRAQASDGRLVTVRAGEDLLIGDVVCFTNAPLPLTVARLGTPGTFEPVIGIMAVNAQAGQYTFMRWTPPVT